MELRKIVDWQTTTGETVTAHNYGVTPQAQALSIQLPIGGLVWNRPVAVLVEHDGATQRIPIPDLTRITQLAIWTTAFLITIIVWLRSR
ncbi:MAG TPA: hypothetical protein VK879_04730 [Candidatus Sulfomarinibacteraceae bacterium]|nr:hypothetical protein [Candidatus Sulfomarinibacteraceae bacterium]